MKDTKIDIDSSATLAIKEFRQTLTTYEREGSSKRVTKRTDTSFHWMITTLASKINPSKLDSYNKRQQEIYNITITSQGYECGVPGFKTREDALENAMKFAERNGIELDGYQKEE